MQQKEIVIIGPAYPLRGGIANLNEALSQSFNDNNITNTIFSFSLQYPNFLFPGKTQYDTSGQAPQGLDINTCINSVNPLNWIITAIKIAKLKPNFVVVRYWLPFMAPCLGSICFLLKLFTNAKIVAITDNVIPHEKRFGDKLFTKYFVASCHNFIAMSKTVLHDLKAFTNKPSKFVPHPIYNIFGEAISKENARKLLYLKQEQKVILFFGFIRKYKGLQLLLNVMTNPKIKQLNITLLVAGEFYELEEECKLFIKENNLENNIILHNHFIDSNKVKEYFCATDIVVQPYITATQSGITQIAYHFATPMLVTNVGGLAETVPHNKVGYVTKVNEVEIADAIIDFYTNNKEQEFRENAATEAKKFTWKVLVEAIVDK